MYSLVAPCYRLIHNLVALCYRLIQNIPYKNHLSHLLRFFFSTLVFFLSMYGLVAPCYRLIQIIPYKNHLSLLLHFFFSSLPDFFQDIQSCCSLSQKDTPLSLYITICRTCYTFCLHLLIFFFLCIVMLQFVTE